MAQPYTARQLNFFKATLKILESAIFEAELLASEVDALQDSPATPVTAVTTTPVINHDALSVSSSYFSILPEPVDFFASPIVTTSSIEKVLSPVITLPSIKNSAAFFHSLPWQTGVSATPINNEHSVANLAITTSNSCAVDVFDTPPQNAKNSAKFFQSLPWKGQLRSPAITPLIVDNIPSNVSRNATIEAFSPITKSSQTVKTCATFFQSLPWDNTIHAPLAIAANKNAADTSLAITALNNHEITTAITANQTIKKTSATFFHSLPWQGKARAMGSKDIRTAMDSDDFAIIAGLATQTALHAAQGGNNEYLTNPPLIGQKTASRFFQTLPW
jgi:hypothetical protein